MLAMLFALIGITYVIPNGSRFASGEITARIYSWGLEFGGPVHILFGTIAALAIGGAILGSRRTITFFLVATLTTSAVELLGAMTGWPFGSYRYTSFLGYRIADEVPFTIPLSWFYIGLASYLIAYRLLAINVESSRRPVRELGAVILGAYLVVVWDLVLEPAMAHEESVIRFWEWKDGGAYLGVPLQNYAAWTMTAVLFIGLSRLTWSRETRISPFSTRLAVLLYSVNLGFASVLSLNVGLWVAPVLGWVLFGAPALWLAVRKPQAATATINNSHVPPQDPGKRFSAHE